MSTAKLFPSHRPSPGLSPSKLQVQTHPPGSHESKGKTFAWCVWGLPGANDQPNCKVLLICEVYGTACGKTETFAHSDKDSTAGVLGVPASGESPGKVFQKLLSEWEEQPSQEQCGDPCLPETSGWCSYNQDAGSRRTGSHPYCPAGHLTPTLPHALCVHQQGPRHGCTHFMVPVFSVRYSVRLPLVVNTLSCMRNSGQARKR